MNLSAEILKTFSYLNDMSWVIDRDRSSLIVMLKIFSFLPISHRNPLAANVKYLQFLVKNDFYKCSALVSSVWPTYFHNQVNHKQTNFS